MRIPVFAVLLLTVVSAFAQQPAIVDAVKAMQAGRLEEAKSALEEILAKEPRNTAAQSYLRTVRDRIARKEAARAEVESVILDRVSLNDAAARDAVDYVMQLLVRGGLEKNRANIVWEVPSDFPGRVTINLTGMPGATALDYVTQAAGLRVSFEEHAIRVFKP